MRTLRSLCIRVASLFRRERRDEELAAELESHLQFHIEDNLRAGMTPEEARRQAIIRLGGVEQTKESYRTQRGIWWLEILGQDVRFAIRSLQRSRGFAATTVLILGLAIGANVAIFSALNAALLRPLPFPSPDRLAMLWTHAPNQNGDQLRTAYWNVEQWKQQTTSFREIATFDPGSDTLTGSEGAEKINVVRASASLARVLGIQPLRGRWFSDDEEARRMDVALISYSFWSAHFAAADPLGSELVIDGVRTQIIGILPESFEFPGGDVCEPETVFPDWPARRAARGSGPWFVLGRLRPDVSMRQAQTEMDTIAERIDEQLPASQADEGVIVTPLRDYLIGPNARLTLWSLAGALLCVLLIACSNVAGLSLARSTVRRKEFAVRAALGASYGRIVRQLLIESLALSTASGIVGLLVAEAGAKLLVTIEPADISHLNTAVLDVATLGWAIVLCCGTGIFVGLAASMPVVKKGFTMSALQAGARSLTPGVHSHRLRRALLVSEFALTTILLVGAGLLMRTLQSIGNVPLGFQPGRVLSAQLSTRDIAGAARREDFYNRTLARVGSLPGVQKAAIIENFFTSAISGQTVLTEGSGTMRQRNVQFRLDAISPAFFEAVGTRLLKGRGFSSEDTAGSRVVIVNEKMARLLWPTLDPIGQKISFGADGSDAQSFTVIGIVEDMRRGGPETGAMPQIFEPLDQDPPGLATLLVRTSAEDAIRLAPSIKSAVADINKYVPVYGTSSLELQLGGFVAERRVQTSLVACFSALALLMAAIGLYGVVQYSVSMRVHEIGIRMAVGAQREDVLRLVLRQGMKIAWIGLLIGAGTSWAAARLMRSLLYGIGPNDPVTFAAVIGIFVSVALAACWIPAHRATKVDPMEALRHE
ncbi:MAG TPA: ABC transporter permease [Candidatus Acidoferrales bacterium]|nr:ABC transporter permease [Candidatus Acidoferrales bacterium]